VTWLFGEQGSSLYRFGLKVELWRFGYQLTITDGEAIAFKGDIHISSALISESCSLSFSLLISKILVLLRLTSDYLKVFLCLKMYSEHGNLSCSIDMTEMNISDVTEVLNSMKSFRPIDVLPSNTISVKEFILLYISALS